MVCHTVQDLNLLIDQCLLPLPIVQQASAECGRIIESPNKKGNRFNLLTTKIIRLQTKHLTLLIYGCL